MTAATSHAIRSARDGAAKDVAIGVAAVRYVERKHQIGRKVPRRLRKPRDDSSYVARYPRGA